MVVGETARADRFSLNGYQKETNSELKNKETSLVLITQFLVVHQPLIQFHVCFF